MTTGKKGSLYVADTRLLHRGTPVEKGTRFILNWTVAVDNFGDAASEKYYLKPENQLNNASHILAI